MKLWLRVLFRIVILAVLAMPVVTDAQTAKVARIGMLLSGSGPPPGQSNPLLDAFRGGLRDFGYVEGQNVIIEYRWSEGRDERLSDLAADLARLNVAVIVTSNTPAALAAKAATRAIPIVMTSVGDPVGSGVVVTRAIDALVVPPSREPYFPLMVPGEGHPFRYWWRTHHGNRFTLSSRS